MMADNVTTTANLSGGRPYRSKKQRPCDSCRRRKTCCVIHGEPPCTLCAKKGRQCTFDESVEKTRGKKKQKKPVINFYVGGKEGGGGGGGGGGEGTSLQLKSDSDKTVEPPLPPLLPTQKPNVTTPSSNSYEFDLPLTIDMWNLLFHDLEDDPLEDLRKHRTGKGENKSPVAAGPTAAVTTTSTAGPGGSAASFTPPDLPSFHLQSQGINRFGVCSLDQAKEYIRGSVDADENIKVQYLSENSYLDPYVHVQMAKDPGENLPGAPAFPTSRTALHGRKEEIIFARSLAGGYQGSPWGYGEPQLPKGQPPRFHQAPVPPLLLVRSDPGLSIQDVATKEKIRTLIGSFGPRLLLIYFRYINPFLPVFSRGLFYFGTNQNVLEFHNSLLATILTLAMDWWPLDPVLRTHTPPSDIALFKIARSATMEEQDMPNYSSLQACILLSQKRPADPSKPDSPFTWSVLGMAASLAEAMGYNYDCTEWDIPAWDKRVRRRIWWTFLIQDTWFSASYGRPLHIATRYWHVHRLTPGDFASYSMNESDAENFRLSVVSFCFMADLSALVASICDDFLYARGPAAESSEAIYRVGCILMEKITTLEENAPGSLHVGSRAREQTARANGAVGLAIQTAKAMILRHMLHRMPGTANKETRPQTNGDHENYRLTVYSWAVDCLRGCIDLVGQLRETDFQSFWYAWSRLNFATVSEFGLLVHLMAENNEERETARLLLDSYHWWLRCNAPAFGDLSLALSLLDGAYAEGIVKERY